MSRLMLMAASWRLKSLGWRCSWILLPGIKSATGNSVAPIGAWDYPGFLERTENYFV